ncbi:MAG: hypothetical protein KDD53_01780, partial [Bdellovibrionales bacterium]|nr:hypothetical protein [Bdellovibrionales bacterium]
VPLLYLFARQLLTQSYAFLCALLLALSHWHVTISRWGWDQVLCTTLFIASSLSLFRAFKRGSLLSAVLGGVLLGFMLATSASALVGIVVLVVSSTILGVQVREQFHLTLVFIFAAILSMAPQLLEIGLDGYHHGSRLKELSILPQTLSGNFAVLATNLKLYGLMLFSHGDRNPRHNIPGLAQLDEVGGVLLLLGMFYCLRNLRLKECWFAILWIFLGLLAGVLSHPIEAPHAYRTFIIVPGCYFLAAIGAERVLARWLVLKGGTLRRISFSIISFAALYSFGFTSYFYFYVRENDPRFWNVTGGAVGHALAREIKADWEDNFEVFVDKALYDIALDFELRVLNPKRSGNFITLIWDRKLVVNGILYAPVEKLGSINTGDAVRLSKGRALYQRIVP